MLKRSFKTLNNRNEISAEDRDSLIRWNENREAACQRNIAALLIVKLVEIGTLNRILGHSDLVFGWRADCEVGSWRRRTPNEMSFVWKYHETFKTLNLTEHIQTYTVGCRYRIKHCTPFFSQSNHRDMKRPPTTKANAEANNTRRPVSSSVDCISFQMYFKWSTFCTMPKNVS